MSEQAVLQLFQQMPCIQADDVTDTLVHVLSAPPHVQVSIPVVQV